MRGGKDKYTDKQKREATHIVDGYERRGVEHDEAERRAWATVNKESGGGKLSGSGRNRVASHNSAHHRTEEETAARRSAAAKKGWETRRARARPH